MGKNPARFNSISIFFDFVRKTTTRNHDFLLSTSYKIDMLIFANSQFLYAKSGLVLIYTHVKQSK